MQTTTLADADLAACRTLLCGGSRSFFAASRLLPAPVARAATALYAFCRLADDAIDEGGGLAALPALQARLQRAHDGEPEDSPADRALAAVLAQHAIPLALPAALLEGFAWDAEGRQYEDITDLHAYAARVAGTVGAMMTLLMGARAPEVVARACDLGVAMQLTNIARDVGEDARNGRLYLPRRWLREAGIDPAAFLAAPAFTPALGEVVRRLLAEAEALYARADAGIAALPLGCRPGIAAARRLYAGIGHQVARRGHDSVTARAVVPRRRKLALVARSLAAAVLPPSAVVAPPLPAVAFLVDAVAAAPPPRRAPARGIMARIDERTIWLIDLFARLEAEDAARLRS